MQKEFVMEGLTPKETVEHLRSMLIWAEEEGHTYLADKIHLYLMEYEQ